MQEYSLHPQHPLMRSSLCLLPGTSRTCSHHLFEICPHLLASNSCKGKGRNRQSLPICFMHLQILLVSVTFPSNHPFSRLKYPRVVYCFFYGSFHVWTQKVTHSRWDRIWCFPTFGVPCSSEMNLTCAFTRLLQKRKKTWTNIPFLYSLFLHLKSKAIL